MSGSTHPHGRAGSHPSGPAGTRPGDVRTTWGEETDPDDQPGQDDPPAEDEGDDNG